MKIEKITSVLGMKVFTDAGAYFGEIEEANLFENKVDGWRIRVDPTLSNLFGGARGVIIPHRFVRAVGDICIISQAAMPAQPEQDLTQESALEEVI